MQCARVATVVEGWRPEVDERLMVRRRRLKDGVEDNESGNLTSLYLWPTRNSFTSLTLQVVDLEPYRQQHMKGISPSNLKTNRQGREPSRNGERLGKGLIRRKGKITTLDPFNSIMMENSNWTFTPREKLTGITTRGKNGQENFAR